MPILHTFTKKQSKFDVCFWECRECDPELYNTLKVKEEQFQHELETQGFTVSKFLELCERDKWWFRREFPIDLRSCNSGVNRMDCGSSPSIRSRIDFIAESSNIVIIFEIDEFQHSDRCLRSEISRANECVNSLFLGGNQRPILILRINPDSYTVNGTKGRVAKAQIFQEAIKFAKYKLSMSTDELIQEGLGPESWKINFMYFDTDHERPCILSNPDFDPMIIPLCSSIV